MNYAELTAGLAARASIVDPWVDGHARFSPEPVLLPAATHAAMAEAAEAVTGVLDEMCRIVAAEPALLEGFFALTPVQRLMFQASHPLWHGHARADVFIRPEGPPVVCEINCDTPSGQPEAVALNGLAIEEATSHAVPTRLLDPCAHLPRALAGLVQAMGRHLARPALGNKPTVGIVYPTEMPEDLALVTLWRQALEERGYAVVLGSPFNLHAAPEGGVALFGQPLDIVLRHYKTDWWGEREPIWHDEAPYADETPLAKPLALLIDAQMRAKVSVVNPFGAVLPQNKRAYAFLWEERRRFSRNAQAIIEAHVPFSLRLEAADIEALRRERQDWVLKSDYGCEGEEVLLGAVMTEAAWNEALLMARRERWIVQRRFDALRDDRGLMANHGIFMVAGRSAGVYTRLSAAATDRTAVSVPTLVVS